MTGAARAAAVAALLLLAALLRLPALDSRPMHADEAILADKFGTLLEHGRWTYDPADYHGPLLERATLVSAWAAGRTRYASLDERVLRLVPAICGVALAISPLLFAASIGWPAALRAAAFAAASPALVYYSRFYIPEMLLVLLTALMLAFLSRAAARPGAGWYAAAGLAAGLALAAKETAVIAIGAAAVAAAAAFGRQILTRGAIAFPLALAAGAAMFLDIPLLVRSFSHYAGRGLSGGLHAHPWWAYGAWLLGPGYTFTEAVVLLLAAGSLFIRGVPPAVRFLRWFTVLTAAAYSLLPYKTPWCVVTPLFGMTLLAGQVRLPPAAFAIAVAHLGWQGFLAAGPRSTDAANPWAYAQTGRGALAIRDAAARCSLGDGISFYSRENLWPLPWYLRNVARVRWSREVSPGTYPAAVVFFTPEAESALLRVLYETPKPGDRRLYVPFIDAVLRPGVTVRGIATVEAAGRCGADTPTKSSNSLESRVLTP